MAGNLRHIANHPSTPCGSMGPYSYLMSSYSSNQRLKLLRLAKSLDHMRTLGGGGGTDKIVNEIEGTKKAVE